MPPNSKITKKWEKIICLKPAGTRNLRGFKGHDLITCESKVQGVASLILVIHGTWQILFQSENVFGKELHASPHIELTPILSYPYISIHGYVLSIYGYVGWHEVLTCI